MPSLATLTSGSPLSLLSLLSAVSLTACAGVGVSMSSAPRDHHVVYEEYYDEDGSTYDDGSEVVVIIEEEHDPCYEQEVEVVVEREPRRRRPRRASSPHSGYTPCGDFLADHGTQNRCQPGQFCSDATFSSCSLGCLSDTNCSSDQVCLKDSVNQVGVCQNADYYSAR